MIPLNMAPTAGRGSAGQLFLASLRHDRLRIIAVGLVTFVAMTVAAFSITPLYQAESTLLVVLGSEYTYRAVAGENINVTNALDREQILRTEIEILSVDDLHREVIREIGVARLYPEVLAPPGPVAVISRQIKETFADWRARAGLPAAEPADDHHIDPVEAALLLFDEHLTMQAVKAGNGIELSFTHPDPEIAAQALTRLEALYLQRRRDLYLSREVQFVNQQVASIRAQLEAADATLTAFKTTKSISDLPTRRAILLNQQGALETDLRTALSVVDEDMARLALLDHQLHELPGAYATATNPLILQIQMEQSRVREELQASKAKSIRDSAQLSDIGADLARLTSSEQEIEELTRARDILDANYKAAVKIRDERQVTETVELKRQSNVRVLQEPTPPPLPLGTRTLILVAGVVLAPLAAGAAALAMHYFRRVYLLPEAVETDTGLRVLATIEDAGRFARRNVLLHPQLGMTRS